MDRIAQIFKSGKKAFIPYITAGYPSTIETIDIMNILVDNGADIIELGFPFSDPTADGPTIQGASQYALDCGFRLSDYFTILEEFRSCNTSTPVVIFSYFNPIFHFGVEAYIEKIKHLGGDAFLIVDLPFEEQEEVLPVLNTLKMHLIQLIAPTTGRERVSKILARASGFVYQIALRGVTGARDSLDTEIFDNAAIVKEITDLPLAVGFGISKAEQIERILPIADGIVIGSAIVKTIHNNLPSFHKPLTAIVQEFAEVIHNPHE